jgi:hypothetical protein
MERNKMQNIVKEVDELKLRMSLLEQLLELKQKIISLEIEINAIESPPRVIYVPIKPYEGYPFPSVTYTPSSNASNNPNGWSSNNN